MTNVIILLNALKVIKWKLAKTIGLINLFCFFIQLDFSPILAHGVHIFLSIHCSN